MKCCNSCAMLCANKDRQSPDKSELEWFSQENMDRLWREAKDTGEFLICHSTDPNAKQYGGAEKIKPGKETACLGFTLWIYQHIKIFEVIAKGSFPRYQKLVGDNAMRQNAMLKAAMNIMTGSTGFGRSGPLKGLLIPSSVEEDRDIRFPSNWDKINELYSKALKKKSVSV